MRGGVTTPSDAVRPRASHSASASRFWLELAIAQKDISVPLSSLFSHNTKAVNSTAPACVRS